MWREHARRAPGGKRLEVAGERVQPVGVEHERDLGLAHDAAHEGDGAVGPADAGSGHERAAALGQLEHDRGALLGVRAVAVGQAARHRLEQAQLEDRLERLRGRTR